LLGGATEIVSKWGRNVSIAYLVELIAGSVFGLHGIGWLVKGRWKTGLIQLAASILVNILFVAFWAPTAGIAVIPQLSLQIGWSLYSARILNDDLRKQQQQQFAPPPQTWYSTYAPPQLPSPQAPLITQYPGQQPFAPPQTTPTWRPPQQPPMPQPGQRAVPSRPAQQPAPPIWPAPPSQPAQPTQRKRPVGPMDTTIPSSKHWPS